MHRSRRSFLTAAAGLAGAAIGPRQADAQAAGPLVVVVHQRNPWQSLSLDVLRAIFAGEPIVVPGAGKALPINDVPNSAARVLFDRKVLRMGPDEVARFWIDRRIRGQSGSPRSVPQAPLRQQLVARFPEGIAYVRAAELARSVVRPLRIDGRQPGDQDYALALGQLVSSLL